MGQNKVSTRSALHKSFPNVIPYIKELKNLPSVKSTNACLLMTQLEYWFAIQKKEFYKFVSPPKTIQYLYQEGQSWTEELGISDSEYRTAFDQIGCRYTSKGAYDAAKRKGKGAEFAGKYYCCYFNKISRQTYYFRNSELVENAIRLLTSTGKRVSGAQDSLSAKNQVSGSRGERTCASEVDVISPESTETTSDNTSENTPNIISEREEASHSQNRNGYEWEKEEDETLGSEEQQDEEEDSEFEDCEDEPRFVIPNDYEPTRELKVRAMRGFPEVLQSHVTEKMREYYSQRGTKQKKSQWDNTWFDWITSERSRGSSDELSAEHNLILAESANDLLNECEKGHMHLWSIEDFREDFFDITDGGYSQESLEYLCEQIYENGFFGRIGEYYFLTGLIEEKSNRKELFEEIRERKLENETINVPKLGIEGSLNHYQNRLRLNQSAPAQ